MDGYYCKLYYLVGVVMNGIILQTIQSGGGDYARMILQAILGSGTGYE